MSAVRAPYWHQRTHSRRRLRAGLAADSIIPKAGPRSILTALFSAWLRRGDGMPLQKLGVRGTPGLAHKYKYATQYSTYALCLTQTQTQTHAHAPVCMFPRRPPLTPAEATGDDHHHRWATKRRCPSLCGIDRDGVGNGGQAARDSGTGQSLTNGDHAHSPSMMPAIRGGRNGSLVSSSWHEHGVTSPAWRLQGRAARAQHPKQILFGRIVQCSAAAGTQAERGGGSRGTER